jgi:hypothetical protein
VTNVILHQFRVEKIIPKKIELCEYSFLESDNEDNEDNEINNENKEKIIAHENLEEEEEDEDVNDEELVQQIATNDIIEINDEENELSSDCNESEGNSYDEESSNDIDVEDFVSKLKQTQPVKQVQKIKTPPKPKRGRPPSKK